ncbi:MAG: ATP-binding protein, partial [Bacteroidota bacterium]
MTSPFKLLESYGAGDKNIFFGRDGEIYALYNLLQQTQLALVYGASGTGKTSLINAGLPRVFKIADWFKISIRRRDNLNQSLCAAVGNHLDGKPSVEELPAAVRRIFEERWIPVYLVFDQFEEIFTLGNEGERSLFFNTLKEILRENSAVKIMLSMREEYIGHLYDYEYILPILFEKRFRVEAMKDDTIVTVVSRTCRVHGIQLEKGDETAKAIMRQLKVGKQAVHLPYLQIYLHSLYGKSAVKYGKAKFTGEIIADEENTLNKVLNRFIGGKIAEAQAHLQALHPGISDHFAESLLDDFATDAGTKKALRVHELEKKHRQPHALIREALQYFDENAKLLRADEDDVERYEPVHDVVAAQIHERRSQEDKEFNAFAGKLESDYERWERDNRAAGRLLPKLDLSKVEIFRKRLEQKEDWHKWSVLVEKSRRHHLKWKWFQRVGVILLIGISIAAGVGFLNADRERKKAEEATAEAK